MPNIENIKPHYLYFYSDDTKDINCQYVGVEKWSINPLKLVSNRRENLVFYRNVENIINSESPDKIIIFNNYTPLTRFIISMCDDKGVELWEDGINHYISEHNGYVFYVKEFVKLLNGFCLKGIFKKNYHGNHLLIRDRFAHKNLKYICNASLAETNGRYLFIGQPLVEEGFIRKSTYINKLREISAHFDNRLDYLLHPRESMMKLDSLNMPIIKDPRGAESYCSRHKYNGYISAYSSVNLNICDAGENYYLAGYFGFHKIHNKLKKLSFSGIKLISSLNEINH